MSEPCVAPRALGAHCVHEVFRNNSRPWYTVARIYHGINLYVLGRVRSRKPHPDVAGEVEVLPLRQGGLPLGWGRQKLRRWPNRSYGSIAYHGV